MEMRRISRSGAAGVDTRDIAMLARGEAASGRPGADRRQAYLDAFHVGAAVIAPGLAGPEVVACHKGFRQAIGGMPELIAASELGDVLREFLDSARHWQQVAWRQPVLGGRHFRVHLSRLASSGDLAEGALVSMIDRTAEIEAERSLRAEMMHDSLTGLPNRQAFLDAVTRVQEAGLEGEGFALLAVDLVRFSRVNECVGALAGDELILSVARRLLSVLRDGDLIARTAGDEFGVLLRLADGPNDALMAAERLRATLATPVRLSDLEIRIDCAIGCALWSDPAASPEDVLRNAQVALKRAKQSCRIEFYQPGDVNRARRRFSLETDLRRAIERDQLALAFQPLLDHETNRGTGFEALARWHHPDHGAVSPVEFITVAEESGLILPLGRWALDAAARTLRQWDAAAGRALPIRLSVNVSAVQLARDSLVEAVAASGFAFERLTLELTESSLVADPERASRVLGMLHDRGAHIAMDDFGTGYSCLASLQKLPIDVLKIDRSLVCDMHENRDSVAIIRAVLSLAKALGISTTAEGIELAETARTLAALGWATGQGYFFARPLAPDDALAYLLDRSA